MQFGTHRRANVRRFGALVRTNRFTFLGALLVAIGLPILLQPLLGRTVLPKPWVIESFGMSLTTSFFALFNAHMILRKVGVLPRTAMARDGRPGEWPRVPLRLPALQSAKMGQFRACLTLGM